MLSSFTMSAGITNLEGAEELTTLLAARSKHSAYQELHPKLLNLLGEAPSPPGKREAARLAYMQTHLPFENLSVIDIGANTGYFSFGALANGSRQVTAVEGNQEHADFVRQAAHLLKFDSRLTVEKGYFSFDAQPRETYDLALCLNVLHHLGDDFGAHGDNMAAAQEAMCVSLRRLAQHAEYCWFQLGFNWKGHRDKPLFPGGLKSELIRFVAKSCEGVWRLERTAAFHPVSGQYEACEGRLLDRMDELGEFLNRPLFLLRRL